MSKVPFTSGSRFSSCASLTRSPTPVDPSFLTDFFSQLHRSFVTCLCLPGASAISCTHHVCIFGISPGGPVSRRQDSVRPRRPEPSRYAPVAIPISLLSSSDGLPDGWHYSALLALVHQRVVVSVSPSTCTLSWRDGLTLCVTTDLAISLQFGTRTPSSHISSRCGYSSSIGSFASSSPYS